MNFTEFLQKLTSLFKYFELDEKQEITAISICLLIISKLHQ